MEWWEFLPPQDSQKVAWEIFSMFTSKIWKTKVFTSKDITIFQSKPYTSKIPLPLVWKDRPHGGGAILNWYVVISCGSSFIFWRPSGFRKVFLKRYFASTVTTLIAWRFKKLISLFLLGIGNMFWGYNFTANQYDLTCPRLLLRTLELITQNYFPGYFLYHYGQNKEGNNWKHNNTIL